MNTRAAMQMALDWIDWHLDVESDKFSPFDIENEIRPALREALAQPQENTARCGGCNKTAEDGWALYCVECWEKAQPQDNLNCKSVQARLATSWGYVLPEDNTK